MTHRKQFFLWLIAAALSFQLSKAQAPTGSKIIPRSQSLNTARQLVGWDNPFWGINRLPQDKCYTSFNLTFEYTRSFKASKILYFLFGDDVQCVCAPANPKIGVLQITISGSDIKNRSSSDWLADYFGLPRDFYSNLTLAPRIENFVLDYSFFVGLDAWLNGLYLRVQGPYTYSKWSLNAAEIVLSNPQGDLPGTVGYFQGYFSSSEVPVANLNRSFLEYASGETPIINNDYATYGEPYCEEYGSCIPLGNISWQPLCCSKMPICGPISRNGFADLRIALGYNFLNNIDGNYHLGAALYAAAPTGNRVGEGEKGSYLMEPIIGNGKHWELGTQITAHHIWWRSEDDETSLGFYFQAEIAHMFKACQTRCFDLYSAGNNSRYIIAQRLASNSDMYPSLDNTADPLGLAFANEYAPVANITRHAVTSSFSAQADLSFLFAYQVRDFRWDLGYNVWVRGCEKLCLAKDPCAPIKSGMWAVKGDERVYGFVNNSNAQSFAVPLAVSNSKASVNVGSNEGNGVNYAVPEPIANNFYSDNPTLAGDNITILPESAVPIYTSKTPVIINSSDFNLSGTKGFSNKLFTHFNWAWTEHEGRMWVPYLGIGAEVEFGVANDKCCKINCASPIRCTSNTCAGLGLTTMGNCCIDFAVTQWGVWFKIGASYN